MAGAGLGSNWPPEDYPSAVAGKSQLPFVNFETEGSPNHISFSGFAGFLLGTEEGYVILQVYKWYGKFPRLTPQHYKPRHSL